VLAESVLLRFPLLPGQSHVVPPDVLAPVLVDFLLG